MINKYLRITSAIFCFLIASILFPEGVMGLLISLALSSAIISFIRIKVRVLDEQNFLTNIFVAALLVRVLLAVLIYGLELQQYFGPDALYYNDVGKQIADFWWGQSNIFPDVMSNASGWGMFYIVGGIYFVSEQNPLAVQLIESVLGAATVILAYLCSQQLFQNNRVARYTAIAIAFFPSMVIWTSQMLKDGFIIFFLVLALVSTLYLQKHFSYVWILSLLVSLLAISSLRFYVFFMLIAAIGGGFILNVKTSAKNLLTRFAVCALIGVAFTFLGVWKLSEEQAQTFVNLDRLQAARSWSGSQEASRSGLGDNVDVSTTSGLISALPMGMLNLYLAPFPWQVGSMTQVMTMPEMVIWWCGLPFLFIGIVYSVRHRLSESISVLFFILILSFSYAVYQGNLGTLYRQRAQLQVFLLIFIAVGFTIMKERRENKILKRRLMRQR